MKWGLVCNYQVKKACSTAKNIYKFLKDNGEVFADKKTAEVLDTKGYD